MFNGIPGAHTLRSLLVAASQNKLQLLGRNTHSLEKSCDDIFVELGALRNELDRGLEVVEEPVDIGKENGDMAACLQVLGDLDGWGQVTGDMGSTFGSGKAHSLSNPGKHTQCEDVPLLPYLVRKSYVKMLSSMSSWA